MKSLLCALLVVCTSGCAYRETTYRYFSPLRTQIGRSSSTTDIRAAILALIPLGTPRLTVEEAIKKNFHTTPYVNNMPSNADKKSFPSTTQIHIMLAERVFFEAGVIPAGSEITNATFIIDKSGKLQDVTVHTNGSWL